MWIQRWLFKYIFCEKNFLTAYNDMAVLRCGCGDGCLDESSVKTVCRMLYTDMVSIQCGCEDGCLHYSSVKTACRMLYTDMVSIQCGCEDGCLDYSSVKTVYCTLYNDMVSIQCGCEDGCLDYSSVKTVYCTLYNDMVSLHCGCEDDCLDNPYVKTACCIYCKDMVSVQCGYEDDCLENAYVKTSYCTFHTDMVSLQCGCEDGYLDDSSLKTVCRILYTDMVFRQCGCEDEHLDYPSLKSVYHTLYNDMVSLQYVHERDVLDKSSLKIVYGILCTDVVSPQNKTSWPVCSHHWFHMILLAPSSACLWYLRQAESIHCRPVRWELWLETPYFHPPHVLSDMWHSLCIILNFKEASVHVTLDFCLTLRSLLSRGSLLSEKNANVQSIITHVICSFLYIHHADNIMSVTHVSIRARLLHHPLIKTLRPRQSGRHFADHIFKCNFLYENAWIPNKISLKIVPCGPITIFHHWFK